MSADRIESDGHSRSSGGDPHEPLFSSATPPTRQSEICAILPSRQPGEGARTLERTQSRGATLRHRRTTSRHHPRHSSHHPRHSSHLTRSLERGIGGGHEDVVDVVGGGEAGTTTEEEALKQLDAVKALTSSLDVKRKTRDQILTSTGRPVTSYQRWKHQQAKAWKRTRRQWKEVAGSWEVWQGSIKVIDGKFGSSVVAYFRFVKWLFFLNLFTTLLILGAVVFPQAFMSPKSFEDSLTATVNTSSNYFVEVAKNCSQIYRAYVAATSNYSSVDTAERIGLYVVDFIQGTGWMEHTVLFAGYYFNKTYYYLDDDDNERFFNMPLSYLLVPAVYFLVTLVLMVNHTSSGVKETLVTQGDKFYRSCNKVFCGWDFSLAEEGGAYLKQKSLYSEYINDLAEERRLERRMNMTTCQRVMRFTIRTVVWLLVLAIWAGAFALVYYAVGVWTPMLLQDDTVASSQGLTLVVEFLPSITMTGLNIIIPPFFTKIVLIEDYTPENEVKITIARTVMLRLTSIVVLGASIILQILSCADEERVCGNCRGSIKSGCWETYIGQEFYKLVVLDFIVIVALVFFVEFPRKFIVKKFIDRSKVVELVGYQEFLIPKNVLEIVYSQTICWIGGFFSPLIPAITVLKFFVFFYCKKLSLIHNCVPASRTYRASRSNYFFMIILLLSFTMGAGFLAFCMGRIPPSQGCGPFRVYTQDEFYMYHVVSLAVQNTGSVLQGFFAFLWNSVVLVVLVILLFLVVYYYRALISGDKRRVELLKEQLASEGKDKQFLLSRVNDALMRGDIHGSRET